MQVSVDCQSSEVRSQDKMLQSHLRGYCSDTLPPHHQPAEADSSQIVCDEVQSTQLANCQNISDEEFREQNPSKHSGCKNTVVRCDISLLSTDYYMI